MFKSLPLLGVFVAVGVIAAVGCASQQTDTGDAVLNSGDVVIRISGAGGTTGVLKGLAEEYSMLNKDISFKFLEGSGSSGGVKGVNADLLDLGAMSRKPKAAELETGIGYTAFAEERVAVVTSPDMSITGLTLDEVRAIFTGVIDNWSLFGGPDEVIRVIVREESDSNTKIIRSGILGEAPFSRAAVVMTSETDTKDALNGATNAIGYLAYSGIIASRLSVHPIALDGIHPADVDGDYPLQSRSLGVAYLPEKFEEVQGFIDFLTGSVVKRMLANQGLISIQ